MKKNLSELQSEHRRLARALAGIGFVSQGSVFARAEGARAAVTNGLGRTPGRKPPA